MKHLITFLVLFQVLSVNSLSSQNLLPEFHRKYKVQEDWSLNKVKGIYVNDSLHITITLKPYDGQLIGEIDSPNSEGFLQFDNDRNSTDKTAYRKTAERIMHGWLNDNKWEIYDGIGGRWFKDSVSSDGYLKYFTKTYGHLHNGKNTIKAYRILGTRLRDEWSNHGYSNKGSVLETIIEITTHDDKTKFIGIAWDSTTRKAASFGLSGINIRLARSKMVFQPRSASNYIGFNVLSDVKITIGFSDETAGIDRKNFKETTIDHLYIGGVKFLKAKE